MLKTRSTSSEKRGRPLPAPGCLSKGSQSLILIAMDIKDRIRQALAAWNSVRTCYGPVTLIRGGFDFGIASRLSSLLSDGVRIYDHGVTGAADPDTWDEIACRCLRCADTDDLAHIRGLHDCVVHKAQQLERLI